MASSELFDLIKKMTKSEKRYFNVNSSSMEGSKKYMTLFKELDKMQVYDEAVLKKNLKSKGFSITHLPVDKVNLTKQILRSLRSFYEGSSPENSILSLLMESEILKNKGFYQSAIKSLEKAKKTAFRYEMYNYIFEINNRMTFFHISSFNKDTAEKLTELFAEMESLKKIVHAEDELRELAYKISLILASKPLRHASTLAAIEELENHPVTKVMDSNYSFYSKIYYFIFQSYIKHAKGNYAQANPHFKKVLELWNSYPHIRDISTRTYKAHITNYLNSCHTLGNYEVFDEWLEKFENIKDLNFDEKAGSFNNFYHIKLLYLLNTGQFKKALEIVPDIAKGLEDYKDRTGKSRETTLRFNVFLVYFLNEKFTDALNWLDTMNLGGKLEARADSRTLARIMRLIVHYELGNSQLLDYLRTSVYRKLRKQDQLHEFERSILDYIRLLEQAVSRKEKTELFKALIAKLNEIGEKYGTNKIPGLEEIISWAESRLLNKPYIEVLEARKKH